MTDKDKDIYRAGRAKSLLDDELISDAFASLEADYIAAWRQTGARDTDARERLWQAVQVIGKVKDHLVSVVANGKVAQFEIDAMTAVEPKAA